MSKFEALTTGARWCDVPIGEQWASRACAHKYLGLWKEKGLLERVLVALQEICVEAKAIDLTRLAVDGFFSAGKGGGEEVDHGYKGKVQVGLLVNFGKRKLEYKRLHHPVYHATCDLANHVPI